MKFFFCCKHVQEKKCCAKSYQDFKHISKSAASHNSLKFSYFFDLILAAFWRTRGAANAAYSMLFYCCPLSEKSLFLSPFWTPKVLPGRQKSSLFDFKIPIIFIDFKTANIDLPLRFTMKY